LRANTQLVKAAGGLEDLRLVVLSTGNNLELHTEIAQLSSHGKLIVLPAIGQAPDALAGAVREIIADVRTVAELRP
jgi:hypothetical protein